MNGAAGIILSSLVALALGAGIAFVAPWWAMPFIIFGVAALAYLGVVAAIIEHAMTNDGDGEA